MDRHGPRNFGMGGGPMRMHGGNSRGGFRGRGSGSRDGPPPEPSSKLFVGNLPSDTPPEKLKSMFGAYGKVTECDIITNYAFVHFSSISDARAAMDNLHQKELGGNRIRVEFSSSKARGRGPNRDGVTCFKCGMRGHLANECRGGPPGPRGDAFRPMHPGPDQPPMLLGGPMPPPHMQGPRPGLPALGPRPGGPPPGSFGPDPRQEADYQNYLRDRIAAGAPNGAQRGPSPAVNGSAAASQSQRYKPYSRPPTQPATSLPSYAALGGASNSLTPHLPTTPSLTSPFGAAAPTTALAATQLAALSTSSDPYASALASQPAAAALQLTAGGASAASASAPADPYTAAAPAVSTAHIDPYQAAAAAAAATPSDPYNAAAVAYQAAVAALAAASAAGTPSVVPSAVPAVPAAVPSAVPAAVAGAPSLHGAAVVPAAVPGLAATPAASATATSLAGAASLVAYGSALQAGAYSAAGYTDAAQDYYKSAAAAALGVTQPPAVPAAAAAAPVAAPLAAPLAASYSQDQMAAALAAANPYAAYQ